MPVEARASRDPSAPRAAIEVTVITVTWAGVMPMDLSMPRSRRRSWVLRATVLNTPREATAASGAVSVGRSVTTLLGRDLSNTELAAELTLSEATVKSHVARIFAKLTLRDRAQAVVLAYETGLVRAGGPPDS